MSLNQVSLFAANRHADIYDQLSTAQIEDASYLLDHLTINSKDNVLDLGCGTGRLTALIAERVGLEGSVIGVDPDQERIQVAISKVGKGDRVRRFIVGSDINFPTGQYDVVTCTDVIHWIEDKETTFRRIYENIKPGGRFGFTTVHEDGIPQLVKDMLRQIGCLEEAMSMTHYVSRNRYKELAQTVGFKVTFAEIRNRTVAFSSIHHYCEFFFSVFHGKFNLTTHPALDDFKKQSANDESIDTTCTIQRLTVILTKPSDI